MKNWNDLQYFYAVAKAGSINVASKSLAVNYSTVSRRINKLEESIGTRLFDRVTNGYELTEAGHAIIEQVAMIEENIENVHRHIMGKDQRLTGSIRLATSDLMAEKLFPDFQVFLEKYPDIQLEVVTNLDTANISLKDADVWLHITDEPADHMVGKKLCDVTGSAYCSNSYLLKHGRANELSDHRWIDWNNNHNGPRTPDGAEVSYRVSSGYSLRDAAKNGFGVANLWDFSTDELHQLSPAPGASQYKKGLWLLTHKELCQTSRFTVFREYLAELVDKYRHTLEQPALEQQPVEMPVVENVSPVNGESFYLKDMAV